MSRAPYVWVGIEDYRSGLCDAVRLTRVPHIGERLWLPPPPPKYEGGTLYEVLTVTHRDLREATEEQVEAGATFKVADVGVRPVYPVVR